MLETSKAFYVCHRSGKKNNLYSTVLDSCGFYFGSGSDGGGGAVVFAQLFRN